MTQEKLDIQVLSRAVATLGRALDEFARDNTNEFVRDACIQRFEYSYDMATKMIKRHLKLTEDDPSAVEAMTAQDRIRRAYDVGILLHSWDRWWAFRDDRAATSHGYNLERALEIIAKIPAFYTEVSHLAGELSKIYDA
jgi:nucleotidyltransferase substrate binding protein (TIGR01987 family)